MKHFKSLHRFLFKSFAVEISPNKTIINDLTVFTSELMKFENPKAYFKVDKMLFQTAKGGIDPKFEELNELLLDFQNLLLSNKNLKKNTEKLLKILTERKASNRKIQFFLDNNVDYIEITKKYSIIKVLILDLFPKIEQKIPDVTLFVKLIEVLKEFNIIDFEIWEKVFRFFFLYCNNFKTLSSFHSVLSDITYKIFPMLKMNEFDQTYNSTTVFYLKEYNLPRMIKTSYFNLFYTKLTRINEFFDCNEDPNLIARVLIIVANIKSKFIKITYMDTTNVRTLYSQWDEFLCKNSDKIHLKHFFLLFDQYSYSGLSQNFISLFEKKVLSSLQQITTENLNLMLILNGWKNIGKFNKEIYDKLMRNFIITKLSYPHKVEIHAKIGFSLVCIGILNEDKELWRLYLEKMGEIDLTEINVLTKRLLHSIFQTLGVYTDIIAELNNEKVKKLIESLKIECINSNKNEETENEIFNGKQSNTISIGKAPPINCIQCQSIEFIKKHGNEIKTDFTQSVMIKKNSIQENRIYQALFKWYTNDQSVKMIRNFNICLYDVDIAIFLTEKKEKIAVEISGASYIFQDQEFLGKKKLKFEILRKLGWKVLVININDKKLFNMLGIPASREQRFLKEMGEYLDKRIREL